MAEHMIKGCEKMSSGQDNYGNIGQQYAIAPNEGNDLGLHPQAAMTFALIGSPGSGKSETANTILGVKRMETSFKSQRVTNEIQFGHVNKNRINLTVIDTPGFTSTAEFLAVIREIDRMDLQNVIYGITVRIGRTMESETAVLYKLLEDPNILEYLRNRTCFVFTNTDELVDFENDSTMLEDQYFNEMFEQWLAKSPIIKKMIHLNNFAYCAITNRLKWENRSKECNKLMMSLLIVKLKKTDEACPEFENRKLGYIEDFLDNERLDEVLSFTVREILELLTKVRETQKENVFYKPTQNRRLADETTQMIFQKLKNKGSSLEKEEVKIIFGYEVPLCTIL